MRKAFARLLAPILAASLLISIAPTTASATTFAPTKVAMVIFENQTYKDITTCNGSNDGLGASTAIPDPYICDHLVPGSANYGTYGLGNLSATAFKSGVNATDFDNSARQYGFITSGDNCRAAGFNGGAGFTDGTWTSSTNGVGADPLSTTDCGVDIFNQYSDANVLWHTYAEGFVSDCTDPYVPGLSSATSQGYARNHVPSTFYAATGTVALCADGGDEVGTSGFNVNDVDDDVVSGKEYYALDTPKQNPFSTMTTTFPDTFNLIIPNQCHNMHNSATWASGSKKKYCQYSDTVSSVKQSATSHQVNLTITGSSNTDFIVGQQFNLTLSSGTGLNGLHTVKSASSTKVTFINANSSEYSTCATTACSQTGATIKADSWGKDKDGNSLPTSNVSTSDAGAQILAGDTWLENNLPDLQDAVGSTGVVIITFDEAGPLDTAETNGNKIATFVVPGTGARLTTSGTYGTASDHASTLKALINNGVANQSGGTTPSCTRLDGVQTPGSETLGFKACDAATALPMSLTVPAIEQNPTYTTGTTTTPGGSFSSNTAGGNALVLAVTNNTTITGFTCPTTNGQTWLAVGNTGAQFCYLLNATSIASGTTISASITNSSPRWVAKLYEVSGVTARDTDTNNTSSSNSVTTLGTGSITTAQANEMVFGEVFANGSVGNCLNSGTPGYTTTSGANGTGNTTLFGYQLIATASSNQMTGDFYVSGCTGTTASYKARAAILALK